MFFREVIPILILSWVGAAVISFAVYEWRQDNDLDDLRDQIDNVQENIGLGDDPDVVGFTPKSVQAGDALLTVRSSTVDTPATAGAAPVGGSLVMVIEHVGGAGIVTANPLSVSGTTSGGASCQPTVAYYENSIAELQAGQETEVEIAWSCPDLTTLTVLGAAEFTVSAGD